MDVKMDGLVKNAQDIAGVQLKTAPNVNLSDLNLFVNVALIPCI